MKKSLILSICFAFWSISAVYADVVYVSGCVWGTWSADTVIVSDSAWVQPDSTLIIQPGVKVLFFDCCKFIVDSNATLIAVGTEEDTILFDEYWEGNHWKGIRFLHANDSSRLEYCHLTNGEVSTPADGGGIYIENSSPIIKKCFINNCSAWDSSGGGGIGCNYNANPIIDSCSIIGNCAQWGGGIGIWNNSNPTITNNIIEGNWSNSSAGGICIDNSSPYIYNNEICGNVCNNGSSGGIVCWDNANPEIINNTISNNEADDDGGGIACFHNSCPMIDSCTISNNNSGDLGGGIFCDLNSNPTIQNSLIDSCSANDDGGGIYVNSSNPTICSNTISNNWAGDHGGGIYCNGFANPYLTGNSINDNSTNGSGGGIHCTDNSDAIIIDNDITGNSAGDNGGGIHCNNSDPQILYNHITYNSCNYDGGGINCINNSEPIIESNIIENNDAGDDAGGIQFSNCNNSIIASNTITSNSSEDVCGGVSFSNSTVNIFEFNEISNNTAVFEGGITVNNTNLLMNKCTIVYNTATSGNNGGGIFFYNCTDTLVNCILWGNEPDQIYQTGGSSTYATYCDIEQIWPGVGNILQYPMFADTANGDYHISWDNYPVHDSTKSPCIDSGNPEPIYDDPDGSRADLGCYYFQQYLPTIILSTYNLEFGLIPVGNQSSLPLTIYCEGDSTLVIDEVLPSDPSFYTDFDSLNNTIPPGDSLLLTVTFEPQIARIFAETISILSNAGNNNSLTVPVSGDGGAVPDTVRNLTVAIEGSDAVLSWDEVTTSVTGYPLTTDAYLIFYSDSTVYGYPHYQYLIYTGDTTYTHAGVVQFAESMFYFVEGYYGEIEVLDELPSNGIPLSREEVHDILNVMIVFSEGE